MDPRPPLPEDARPAPGAKGRSEAAPSVEAEARLEVLLRGEDLLPVPLGLLARVRDAVKESPPAPFERRSDPEARDAGTAYLAPPARGRSVAQRVAAAVLVAVGAALTYAGVEPVAAAGETLRGAGVPTELGLARRPMVAEAVVRPITDRWGETWPQPPDLAVLAGVPASMPGGPLALASLSLVLLGSGLGLAWRARGRRTSSFAESERTGGPS